MNFKSTLCGAAAVVAMLALLLGAVGSASAQTPLGPPSGIGAGVFLPNTDWAKKGGDSQLALDLRYNFMGIPLTDTRTVLDLGYEGGSHSGSHSTIVPLTIGEYFGSGSPTSGMPYIGAGVGAYYIDQSAASVTTRFGGYVAAGYTLSALFAEAKYQFLDKGNGTTLEVGLMF